MGGYSFFLYNQININACALIGQLAMVYCATWEVGKTLEEFVNHLPSARDLPILLVLY